LTYSHKVGIRHKMHIEHKVSSLIIKNFVTSVTSVAKKDYFETVKVVAG